MQIYTLNCLYSIVFLGLHAQLLSGQEAAPANGEDMVEQIRTNYNRTWFQIRRYSMQIASRCGRLSPLGISTENSKAHLDVVSDINREVARIYSVYKDYIIGPANACRGLQLTDDMAASVINYAKQYLYACKNYLIIISPRIDRLLELPVGSQTEAIELEDGRFFSNLKKFKEMKKDLDAFIKSLEAAK